MYEHMPLFLLFLNIATISHVSVMHIKFVLSILNKATILQRQNMFTMLECIETNKNRITRGGKKAVHAYRIESTTLQKGKNREGS